MADVIRKATNKFTKGLVMDFSPENTQQEVLTHALNATLLTFNGNELSLQNDMGNARVETAYLPEGYMPVGTCEYGGIVYIVSYNPLEDKSQIGCFPSPERNISNKELGKENAKIYRNKFQKFEDGEPTGELINTTQYVLLKNDNLNPGDKFLVCSGKEIYNERLADLWVDKDNQHYAGQDRFSEGFELVNNPVIALNVVSIEDSGKIVYLNSDIKKYTSTNTYSKEVNGEPVEFKDVYKYHILGEMPKNGDTYEQASVDIDSYRNVLNSGYSVFKSKISGKLAILAELITIDSYSVTHSLIPKEDAEGSFDIVIHTEITPEITSENYNTVPKLQYYYLKDSQGYLQASDTISDTQIVKTLFIEDQNGEWSMDSSFLQTSLEEIYTPIVDTIKLDQPLNRTGQFNFPTPKTYHGRMYEYGDEVSGTVNDKVYTKFTEGKYHRINKNQVTDNKNYYTNKLNAKFYRYDTSGTYVEMPKTSTLDFSYTYYVKTTEYEYIDVERNAAEFNKGGIVLYKLTSEPSIATKEEVEDKLIEKFRYVEIHSYREASSTELKDGTKLYIKDGNTYTSHDGLIDPSVTYYVLEEKQALVSIGFDIKQEDYKDIIFYYPTTKDYVEALEEDLEVYWDFNTYPLENEAPWGCPISLYWRKEIPSYRPATEKEIVEFETSELQFFYRTDYVYVSDVNLHNDSDGQLFMTVPIDTYVSFKYFTPDTNYNYISGYDKPYHKDEPKTGFPGEGPIYLFTVADFIPSNLEGDDSALQYNDIKLANIKLPSEVSVNGLDLPFKYDYTLVPCMNFGRLDHLAVSNTVDFSKLHAFKSSDFTTWKYRIDDNQLRLTFGADVYDTYETDKVDGLVLEFYDLWGFAGSIEITDKKSYSGIFTKIIPLNALNAISKNRIIGSTYSTSFERNINIREKQDDTTAQAAEGQDPTFVLDGKEVQFRGYNSGWRYVENNASLEENNDCGTLYSNVLYGVKTYLRRTMNAGQKNEYREFIETKTFFLYTLPIYNDYYYTINDFSGLTNPQIDLALTYKMQDKSTREVYNTTGIINGFCTEDNETIGKYLGGFLQGMSSINAIKYYKYSGQTDVSLEIGLKKEYNDINMYYSPDINQFYSCKLELVSDDSKDRPYTAYVEDSTGLSVEEALNYKNKNTDSIPLSVNDIHFAEGGYTRPIEKSFASYNFLSNQNGKSIAINYDFVVGYTVDITDIKSTEVQATTICALYHQDSSGVYNSEDFGIYEQDGQYMSSAMFYNSGTADQEIFGMCRQISTEASKTMIEQCQSFTSTTTDAQEIKTAGKLNTGDPLKQMVQYIGKLTFCQPHAHGLSDIYGVNIHEGSSASFYGIPPEVGGWDAGDSDDDTMGTAPRSFLLNNPKYNLCVNTKNAVAYNSEFISTIDWKEIEGQVLGINVDNASDAKGGVWKTYKMREYTGFTSDQVATFNKKLLKTMSSVYAYNPDYDSLEVNVGNVSVQKRQAKFVSNLINTHSDLEFTGNLSLNDFIYLGPIKFSDYLVWLNKYSENSEGVKLAVTSKKDDKVITLEQLQFIPSFTYCGTSDANYLISSLTYNTPTPVELEDELSFKASNTLVIKHSDGNIDFITGTPNKKALYGFNSELKKLIQLDVTNYTIDSEGNLKLNSNDYSTETQAYGVTLDQESLKNAMKTHHNFSYDFVGSDGITSTIDLMLDVTCSAPTYRILGYGTNSVIIAVQRLGTMYAEGFDFSYNISVKSVNNNKYSYYLNSKDAWVSCNGVVLYPSKVTLDGGDNKRISLMDQSYEQLHSLIYDGFATLVTPSGTTGYMIEALSPGISSMYLNGEHVNRHSMMWASNYSRFVTELETAYDSDYNYIELYEFTLDSINFDITRRAKLATSSESILKTSMTTKYYETVDHKYRVLDTYKDARIRGTSLTLNDLMYEPNVDGHRLFIRNNIYKYDSTYRGKLYYRSLDVNDAEVRASWDARRTVANRNKNSLYLFTGPCFITDNL